MKLHIPWSKSLKDKRSVRQRLQTRLVQDFHLSLLEDGKYAQYPETLVLKYCMLCHDGKEAERYASRIEKKTLSLTDAILENYDVYTIELEE